MITDVFLICVSGRIEYSEAVLKKTFMGGVMKRGFTLVEMLLGAAILTIVFLALTGLFTRNIILNKSNRNLTVAISHAQRVMEDIKGENFDNITANINGGGAAGWDWDDDDITANGLNPLLNENTNTDCLVGGVPAPCTGNLLDIQITVSWEDVPGRVRNITLETLVGRP